MFLDDESTKTIMASENETPYQILKQYGITPETKIVFINGVYVANSRMDCPIKASGTVFMAIKSKSI